MGRTALAGRFPAHSTVFVVFQRGSRHSENASSGTRRSDRAGIVALLTVIIAITVSRDAALRTPPAPSTLAQTTASAVNTGVTPTIDISTNAVLPPAAAPTMSP